ncbi:M48 family metallopeptidase [Alishewanella sp. 16-MA]|uniref:M48 family metallopeptidase n=1 Tax=Alishewanella maricola TaxID=2795740 RepID=A0ABS8C4R2_9ALTE|nr:M48 family metallopeptidase [Alishewanella maricola]MCB5227128.1 M48 family metallopeptidase [Alishewanella maricola]
MIKKLWVSAICTVLLVACAESPTGRRQVMLYDSQQLSTMGAQTFEEMKAAEKISNDAEINRYVLCVSNALLKVTPDEYQQQSWEIVVFDSEQVNAFALPGGKIGVYTGLLKVAETPAQLAAVVGHEIAHVMAGHSNERLSTNQFLQMALALGDAGSKAYGVQYQQELMAALGVGAQLGVALPFSRAHETESDIIGLELMAKAGFDPSEAVNLWRNMAKASGPAGPQFLSSHPVPETRITTLQDMMPEANGFYTQRKAAGNLPSCRKPAKL